MPRADKSTEKKVKLTKAEKKQIAALMQQARQQGSGPHSAQETIPYQRMWPDGVCLSDDTHYTKTVQFQDINYQLAQNEDKNAIFESYCDFLNCATRSHTNTIPLPKSLWALRPCSAKNGGLPVI